MRFLNFLCFMFFLFSFSVYSSYTEVNLDVSHLMQVGINKDANYEVQKFYLESFFAPENLEYQELISYSSTGNLNFRGIEGYEGRYYFLDLSDTDFSSPLGIETSFSLNLRPNIPRVYHGDFYPREYSRDFYPYLSLDLEYINSDEELLRLSSEIVGGIGDSYEAVLEIAKWIMNEVEYDLSSVLENPNQSSTQVLVSRQGVCREITNLFVSMVRSIGIPARVVSGFAYTEDLELVEYLSGNWGGHAWAEVYISGVWVPFDLTYKQIGYVDASHLRLFAGPDLLMSMVSVNASGYGFSIDEESFTSSFDFNSNNMIRGNSFDSGISFEVFGTDNLGFGSLGYIEVEVVNSLDFYRVFSFYLSGFPEGVLIDDNERKFVYLPPNSSKKVAIVFKIPEDLESGYRYVFPFEVSDSYTKKRFDVSVSERGRVLGSLDVLNLQTNEREFIVRPLDFECLYYFSSPMDYMLCSVINRNNFMIEELAFCSSLSCDFSSLMINSEVEFKVFASSFNESIYYSYAGDTFSGDIFFQVPSLDLRYYVLGNRIYMEVSVFNDSRVFGHGISVYRNDDFLSGFSPRVNSFDFELVDGYNDFRILLNYEGRVFDEVYFEIDHLLLEERGYFSKLFSKIRNFFGMFFR